ncbi:MAG: radical SAM protein [Oscillospiraceae bacterium]|jgi:radical SAM protein with 4Fe4S-binding SPASM domain|nr:radical SAM protein [Oscillospiraceae bacterium]
MSGIAFPGQAILELTYNCNNQCKFCYCPWENTAKPELRFEKHEELSLDSWKRALSVLERIGVKRVGLSGGEPLLKDCFPDLLRHIRQNTSLNKGKKISVISNGLLMNEQLLSLFKEMGVHLQLSLPGLTTYEWHTGSDNAATVLHWLRRAKAKGVTTTANVIVSRRNIHELYETVANAVLAGADTIMLNRVLIGGRGIGYMDELSLSRAEIREMVDVTEKVLETSGSVGAVGTEIPLCVLDEDKLDKYEYLRVGGLCAAARGFFVIDPSGYVRACNHSPRRLGHILEDEIIADIEYWNLFSGRAYGLPEMCDSCRLVNQCDCGCREAAAICYGSLDEPDPSMVNI